MVNRGKRVKIKEEEREKMEKKRREVIWLKMRWRKENEWEKDDDKKVVVKRGHRKEKENFP